MAKLLYFDVETTGLSPYKNDVIQFSAIVEIDNVVKEEFNIFIKPFDFTNVESKALAVNDTKLEELYNYTPPKRAFLEIEEFLGRYIRRTDKTDKFIPVAYNGRFDLDFMSSFFKKNKSFFFGSWQNWQLLDPLALWRYYRLLNHVTTINNKLATACEFFGIPLKAHDAMEDIRATRKLHKMLCGLMDPTVVQEVRDLQPQVLVDPDQTNLFNKETNDGEPVTQVGD